MFNILELFHKNPSKIIPGYLLLCLTEAFLWPWETSMIEPFLQISDTIFDKILNISLFNTYTESSPPIWVNWIGIFPIAIFIVRYWCWGFASQNPWDNWDADSKN